ncbi:MAG: STAS domain-containing protein [Casimicrobium sp.]
MKIEGELTYANANTRWQALAREAVGATEIDCSGVTRLDSAGLAVLTSLRGNHLDEGNSGGSVPTRRLIHPTPEIARLATAYDVAALFE